MASIVPFDQSNCITFYQPNGLTRISRNKDTYVVQKIDLQGSILSTDLVAQDVMEAPLCTAPIRGSFRYGQETSMCGSHSLIMSKLNALLNAGYSPRTIESWRPTRGTLFQRSNLELLKAPLAGWITRITDRHYAECSKDKVTIYLDTKPLAEIDSSNVSSFGGRRVVSYNNGVFTVEITDTKKTAYKVTGDHISILYEAKDFRTWDDQYWIATKDHTCQLIDIENGGRVLLEGSNIKNVYGSYYAVQNREPGESWLSFKVSDQTLYQVRDGKVTRTLEGTFEHIRDNIIQYQNTIYLLEDEPREFATNCSCVGKWQYLAISNKEANNTVFYTFPTLEKVTEVGLAFDEAIIKKYNCDGFPISSTQGMVIKRKDGDREVYAIDVLGSPRALGPFLIPKALGKISHCEIYQGFNVLIVAGDNLFIWDSRNLKCPSAQLEVGEDIYGKVDELYYGEDAAGKEKYHLIIQTKTAVEIYSQETCGALERIAIIKGSEFETIDAENECFLVIKPNKEKNTRDVYPAGPKIDKFFSVERKGCLAGLSRISEDTFTTAHGVYQIGSKNNSFSGARYNVSYTSYAGKPRFSGRRDSPSVKVLPSGLVIRKWENYEELCDPKQTQEEGFGTKRIHVKRLYHGKKIEVLENGVLYIKTVSSLEHTFFDPILNLSVVFNGKLIVLNNRWVAYQYRSNSSWEFFRSDNLATAVYTASCLNRPKVLKCGLIQVGQTLLNPLTLDELMTSSCISDLDKGFVAVLKEHGHCLYFFDKELRRIKNLGKGTLTASMHHCFLFDGSRTSIYELKGPAAMLASIELSAVKSVDQSGNYFRVKTDTEVSLFRQNALHSKVLGSRHREKITTILKAKKHSCGVFDPLLDPDRKGSYRDKIPDEAETFRKKAADYIVTKDFERAKIMIEEAITHSTVAAVYKHVPEIFAGLKKPQYELAAKYQLALIYSQELNHTEAIKTLAALQPEQKTSDLVLAISLLGLHSKGNPGAAIEALSELSSVFAKEGERDHLETCLSVLREEPNLTMAKVIDQVASYYASPQTKVHHYLRVAQRTSDETLAGWAIKRARLVAPDSVEAHIARANGVSSDLNRLYKLYEAAGETHLQAMCAYDMKQDVFGYQRAITLLKETDKIDTVKKCYKKILSVLNRHHWYEQALKTCDEAKEKLGPSTMLLKARMEISEHYQKEKFVPAVLELGEAYEVAGKLEKSAKVYQVGYERSNPKSQKCLQKRISCLFTVCLEGYPANPSKLKQYLPTVEKEPSMLDPMQRFMLNSMSVFIRQENEIYRLQVSSAEKDRKIKELSVMTPNAKR